MLTWADKFIQRCGNFHALIRRELDKEGAAHQLPPVKNDYEAAQALASFARGEAKDLVTQILAPKTSTPEPSEHGFMLALCYTMSPLLNILKEPDPICIQLTEDLAQDFRNAKPPETDLWKEAMAKQKHCYIDIPKGLIKSSSGVDLRMIMVSTYTRSDMPGELLFRYSCVFSGSGEIGFVFWATKGGGHDHYVSYVSEGMGAAEADETKAQIDSLVKLCLLYYMTSNKIEQPIPHISPDALAKIKRHKHANKLRNFSLFKVVKLFSPKDRFSRTNQDKTGWKLGVSTTVRGHFRMQACGPNWSQHRLIWIESFEKGPNGAPKLHKLHVLE